MPRGQNCGSQVRSSGYASFSKHGALTWKVRQAYGQRVLMNHSLLQSTLPYYQIEYFIYLC